MSFSRRFHFSLLVILVAIPSCKEHLKQSAAASRPATAVVHRSPAEEHRDHEHDVIQAFYDETLVKPYDSVGHHSDRWDADARAALSGLADSISAEDPGQARSLAESAVTRADAAIAAGCDDGAVTYTAARLHEFIGMDPDLSADLYRTAARQLQDSHYPPIRLAYSLFRTANSNLRTAESVTRQQQVDQAIELLSAIASDPGIPNTVLAELCNDLINLRRRITGDRLPGFERVDAILSKANPDSFVLHLTRGRFYVSYAWDARGNGFADSVPASAWPVFADRLDKAEAELTRAWQLDPFDSAGPRLMLTVELGQGKGRKRMELWYGRAMAANPDDYEAAQAKLEYLTPKWYGTPQDMLSFARQTYKESDEHSRLRLILFNAHQTLAYMAGMQRTGQWQPDPTYWAQPGVWEDLHPLLSLIVETSPPGANVGWRSVYAIVAYHSQHYTEAREQLDLLDGRFDPNVIPSSSIYRQLRDSARRLAASRPSSPGQL